MSVWCMCQSTHASSRFLAYSGAPPRRLLLIQSIVARDAFGRAPDRKAPAVVYALGRVRLVFDPSKDRPGTPHMGRGRPGDAQPLSR